MKVVTVRQEGFKWVQNKGVYVKGFLFVEYVLLQGEDLAQFIATLHDITAFEKFIAVANGSFALIVNRPGLRVAAVDRLRSLPLFFAEYHGLMVVGDDAERVRETAGLPIQSDWRSLQEFGLTGFVLGSDTLISGLRQLRAGERVLFVQGKPSVRYYYVHRGTVKDLAEESSEFDRLDVISINWGKRLVQSAGTRPLVIPLSGGYDSRYIAAVLREISYPKLIAYTYGRPDSPEVKRSQEVARRLDIPWYYVEYNEQKFCDFINSENHTNYCKYAHQRSSLPHYQDFIALQDLMERGVIANDAIVVPGFCGDIFGGSYAPREVSFGRDIDLLDKDIGRQIDEQQLYLKIFFRDHCPRQIYDHILQEVDRLDIRIESVQDFVTLNNAFFIVHKVAKYVVHSLRVYEYFGLEWRMPLWDNELMDYWYQVPYEYRSHVNMYERYLLERPFKRLNIGLSRPPGGGLARFHQALDFFPVLRRHRMFFDLLVKQLHARLGKKNPTAFEMAKEHYEQELQKVGMPQVVTENFVAIFARWFLWYHYKAELALKPVR